MGRFPEGPAGQAYAKKFQSCKGGSAGARTSPRPQQRRPEPQAAAARQGWRRRKAAAAGRRADHRMQGSASAKGQETASSGRIHPQEPHRQLNTGVRKQRRTPSTAGRPSRTRRTAGSSYAPQTDSHCSAGRSACRHPSCNGSGEGSGRGRRCSARAAGRSFPAHRHTTRARHCPLLPEAAQDDPGRPSPAPSREP